VSANFSISADAWLTGSAGDAGAIGTGAYTIAVLARPTAGNNNCGLVQGRTASAAVRSLFEDALALFGENDFSSGYSGAGITQGNWYVFAQSKAAGSNTYRHHIWPYASDGSGTMSHGVAASSSAQGDGSAVTELRVGWAVDRGNGDIAVVAFWTSALSDASLDALKSANLTAWSTLSPTELVTFENWNGSTGWSAKVGTSSLSSITGTVGTATDPPSFNFALAAADNGTPTFGGPAPGLFASPSSIPSPWQGAESVSAQVATPSGSAAAAVAATGSATKIAPVAGRCAAAATSAATAVKVMAQTGSAPVAARTSGAAAKVTPQSAPGVAAARTSGAAAKITPKTGVTAATATSTGSVGSRAETGATFTATATVATAVKVAAVNGRCAAGAVARATAAKVAAPSANAVAAGFTRAAVAKRATPVVTTPAIAMCRGAAAKKATPTASASTGASCAATAVKRAAQATRVVAIATSAKVDVTRYVTGHVGAAAVSWTRRRTRRPSSGTTSRPGSGTTPRPYTGTIVRP